MKSIDELRKNERLNIIRSGSDGGHAMTVIPGQKKPITIVFSWGGGWDHVSVSYPNRTPTWDEMCMIKNMFFHEEECVVQYHPPKSEYVNKFPHCLHLWRPQEVKVPMPPQDYV